MGVRKKDRFEVFKRDKFTCQYCGRSSSWVSFREAMEHWLPGEDIGITDGTRGEDA